MQKEKYEYVMSDAEKEELTRIVENLAKNYLNGIWDMNPNGRHFRIEDCHEIQERYSKVKSDLVREYEKSLNGKILKFFKLKKKDKNENIKFSDVINIVRYKLYVKPKRKIACFMWDIPYDIYHLVNHR